MKKARANRKLNISNPNLLNSSEIARGLKLSEKYVRMLLTGKRFNKRRLIQIKNFIYKGLKELLELTNNNNHKKDSKFI